MAEKAQKAPKAGDLRVWHIPQVPMKPFHVHVKNEDEAKKVITILADYDDFQFKNKIKPDYSSMSGLEIFIADTREKNASGTWEEWEDEAEGSNILEIMREEGR